MAASVAPAPTPPLDARTGSPRRDEGYEDLEPLFTVLSELAPDDPRRSVLREDILCRALPLAEHIARRFTGRGQEYDDLLQTARVGLVKAVDGFDPNHGATFLGYAIPTVMGEVRRYFRDRTWAVRVSRTVKELHVRIGPATEVLAQRLGRMPTARELATELDVELGEVTLALVAANCYTTESLDNPRGDNPEQDASPVAERLGKPEPCYELLEGAMAVRPLLAALPERERQILEWRYYGQLTQREIAARLGISQMQVSRLLTRTLDTLRREALSESPSQS
ncbi:SigB/SigF/SigG family RNA polymerase sigma factor [Nocardia sp. NPDC056100]|uniref:SigB/SigF/SigG family RNA polymerase sigma factor n=1 Tax=Nocardia sp. NPDC056100 TaxID=3345712 RepID=UPI0035E208DB